MDERPVFETPHALARRIVAEEWGEAVKVYRLTPGSVTERVVARIINRLDEAVWPATEQLPAGEK